MSAHFWLSKASVTVTQESIGAMTEEEARWFLAELRWGSREQQVCPDCGAVDKHSNIRTRRQWRCKHCFHTFSVTSGTPFADQKIGYRKLSLAMFAFVINQKGLAALALRRIIGGQYRTSFTLLHKIREAVMLTVREEKLTGVVEIDGAHFSGRKRKPARKPAKKKIKIPAKYRELRSKDGPKAFQFHPNRRIVMTLRAVDLGRTTAIDYRNGSFIGKGATRTLVAICRSENAFDAEALVRRYVDKNAAIRTDEQPAYSNLKLMGYVHDAVNHSVEFVREKDGVNENQAESFFARMRRSCIGIYHRITPKYMLDYATEMAWREDVRRMDTKSQMAALVRRVMGTGLSIDWKNYCRGNHRAIELLFDARAVAAS